MDNYLFYGYLKWHDENDNGTMHKLIKLPLLAKILLFALILSGIMGICSLFINTIMAYISIVVELITCLITYFYSEKIYIDKSHENYEKYKRYCINFYLWLNNYDIKEREQILEIKSRFIQKQAELKDIISKKKEIIDTWMQVFIFPIILAIVSKLLDSQTDINKIFAYTSSILIVFISIYLVVIVLLSIVNIFENMKINKYETFISDLQGVIDIKYGIS